MTSPTNAHHRLVIKFAGESGQGINSVGEIIAKTVKRSGYKIYGYREYPSIIKGGHACYQLEISDKPLRSPSRQCDMLVCTSRNSIYAYLKTLRPGGKLLHSMVKLQLSEADQEYAKAHDIEIEFVDTAMIALEKGGKAIMSNVVLLGIIWQLLGLKLNNLETMVREQFADKKDLVEDNVKCLYAGYQYSSSLIGKMNLQFSPDESWSDSLLISGNQASALGAISAGVRMYVGYPMTPVTAILAFLASKYHKTGMFIKQAEDEITAAQMALGAMAMGTRALTATSGGGFDLMTETISLSGIIETPFVCILGQRPGPATGIPTWTSTGDLNLAVYAGHGEFPRCVMAMSDISSAYKLVQDAFNIAEYYQIPVFVLTEKQLGESLYNLDKLPETVPISRNLSDNPELMQSNDRFKITDSGISPRWFPGTSAATYNLNSDEHLEDGSLTEDAEPAKAMIDKRARKLNSLSANLAEPELYGDPEAETTFVGWGSVKNVMLDAIDLGLKANYLHFEFIYPLRTDKFNQIVEKASRVVLIENNAMGQLGTLITAHSGYIFNEKFLKYDGRPFYIDEILEYL